MADLVDMTGRRYGKLVALHRDGLKKWVFQCDCGQEKSILGYSVRSGETRSCGCLRNETARARNTTHGMHYSRTCSLWRGMRARCNDKRNPLYGGRGIKCHPAWSSFTQFLADVGECPSPQHSLDRIDPNGNYEPGNVRWVTWQQQALNKRRTIYVAGKPLPEWAREMGISYPAAKKLLLKRLREYAASQEGAKLMMRVTR